MPGSAGASFDADQKCERLPCVVKQHRYKRECVYIDP